MQFVIDLLPPDGAFWEAYADLWAHSQHKSGFQAPHYIRFLVSQAPGSLAFCKGYRGDTLIGAAFLHKEGNAYQFLSDLKTDHNFFMLREDITLDETEAFFAAFVGEVEKRGWALRLNNQPFWAPYMESFIKVLKNSKLYWDVAPYNPCLVLEEATPEALFKATNKQKLRQKWYRLQDQGEAVFEVFHGEEDLDHWLQEFYDVHVKRWAQTNTPSSFRFDERRVFYKACLKTWIEQGIAVRFSIKLNDKRIAFVVALLEDDFLVHHTTSFDLDYEKQSPGLIIISQIGKWMADRNMRKMEFGDGGEKYKYQFAKQEQPLKRIFISAPTNIPFILKTRMVKFLWEHMAIHNFYADRVRPYLLRVKTLKKMVT